MGWPGQVTRDEKISRFVVSNRQIKNGKEGQYIHHAVLCPDEKKNFTTSVFRISELSDDKIWILGDDYIDDPVLARLDVYTAQIFDHKLDFDPDDIPPRHANIIKWPTDRSQYRSIAQQIAAKSLHEFK